MWIGILLFLLLVVAVLLFTPLVLVIDSVKDVYLLRWGPVRASLAFSGEHVMYQLQIFLWKREGNLFDLILSTQRTAPPNTAERKPMQAPTRTSRQWSVPWSALLWSFRVRRFLLSLDTGDVLCNAWLFPLAHVLRMHGHDVQ
ncbi:MAG TPA: hypothetical protein PK760_13190, partial [Flavobacteriales bacterium]|nr:hypothetical protein [Flavobacteriales bacterium]